MSTASASGNEPRSNDTAVPLCVDLDGTLIRSDLLWESAIHLWRHPLLLLRAVLVLITQGKAALKGLLAERISIEPGLLPYREDVLAYINTQREAGRSIALATASHRRHAHAIAEHLGIFSRVFATEEGINLAGHRKLQALESAYGERGFDYIGDSRKDIPIFSAARSALVVTASRSFSQQVSEIAVVREVFYVRRPSIKTLAKAMRVHQWAKNVLLAVPLLTAHLLHDAMAWLHVVLAFLAFGLVASSTYLINDLLDLASDRAHTRKRFRPLASGMLSIPAGLSLTLACAVSGLVVALMFLPSTFNAFLGLYVVLTLAYSFDLKRRLMVDVLALAVLYTLRILAGAVAIGVVVSEWLLMFSLFIFLSLAFLKRVIELTGAKGPARIAGRGYSPVDIEVVRVMGVASGMMSVLVLALYISSPAVTILYQSPKILWLICPLVIYWVARIWFLAGRGEVDHDPVVFALFDWRSYIVGAIGAVIAFFATTGVNWLLSTGS